MHPDAWQMIRGNHSSYYVNQKKQACPAVNEAKMVSKLLTRGALGCTEGCVPHIAAKCVCLDAENGANIFGQCLIKAVYWETESTSSIAQLK